MPAQTAVPRSPPSTLARRLIGAAVALGILAVLGVAAWLPPDRSGVGTHRRLGLPPCGWLETFGRPCPTCGMTTAFAHAARAELSLAFRAQPFGAVLALAASAGFWVAVHVAFTGSALGDECGRLLRPRVLWCVAVLGVGAWIYKIVALAPGSAH